MIAIDSSVKKGINNQSSSQMNLKLLFIFQINNIINSSKNEIEH